MHEKLETNNKLLPDIKEILLGNNNTAVPEVKPKKTEPEIEDPHKWDNIKNKR